MSAEGAFTTELHVARRAPGLSLVGVVVAHVMRHVRRAISDVAAAGLRTLVDLGLATVALEVCLPVAAVEVVAKGILIGVGSTATRAVLGAFVDLGYHGEVGEAWNETVEYGVVKLKEDPMR